MTTKPLVPAAVAGALLALPLAALDFSGASADPAALERALGTVSADEIRADLHFIAADELRGRDTPSEGLRIAARFLRARMQRLGLLPGVTGGSFLHEYEMQRVKLDFEQTALWLERGGERRELAFGADYFFHPSGIQDLDEARPLVYVGAATSEDLAGVDLAGRFALVRPHEDVSRREREAAVRDGGGVGILVLPEAVAAETEETSDDGSHDKSRGERMRRYVGRGHIRLGRDAFPQAYLTPQGARTLLGDATGLTPGRMLGDRVRDRRVTGDNGETHVLENVAALWPGADPALSREVIVISAHYDHVGERDDEIYNGADDNGSGTVALLALGEALVEYGPMRRSVLLLWVSGEEKGLKGSYAWTVDPRLPEGLVPVLNLNLDMIGRNAPDSLLVTPTSDRPEYNALVKLAESRAPLEGFPELGGCDDYWSRSDHANFASNLGIPVAFLFSDVHEDYHRPTDTADKVDCDKVRRVSRLILRMLDGLQADDLDL